jgi:hypothetical protein
MNDYFRHRAESLRMHPAAETTALANIDVGHRRIALSMVESFSLSVSLSIWTPDHRSTDPERPLFERGKVYLRERDLTTLIDALTAARDELARRQPKGGR